MEKTAVEWQIMETERNHYERLYKQLFHAYTEMSKEVKALKEELKNVRSNI